MKYIIQEFKQLIRNEVAKVLNEELKEGGVGSGVKGHKTAEDHEIERKTPKEYFTIYDKAYDTIANKAKWRDKDFNKKFDKEVNDLTHKVMLKKGYKWDPKEFEYYK